MRKKIVINILFNQSYFTKMARAIFEYTKTILVKVSFNTDLFCRELEKALQRLLPYEINELTIWIKSFIADKPELYSCMALIKNSSKKYL